MLFLTELLHFIPPGEKNKTAPGPDTVHMKKWSSGIESLTILNIS